ncbi:MAG: hypothetical protein DMG36_26795 [Acidobacteria bacterium]|nr:MAG: hypothetical protein DMG36_26795 [Acidobacteriota bacterium]
MHIRIESLCKRYGRIDVLDHVTLDIAKGKIVAILGPNGAGKTTLLRCLAGIVIPEQGQILYDGQPFRRDRLDLRKQIFFLPDFPLAFSDMNVLRHISMCLRLYDAAPDPRPQRVVDVPRSKNVFLRPLCRNVVAQGQGRALHQRSVGTMPLNKVPEPFCVASWNFRNRRR